MASFSQKYGYTPTERAFQRERVDDTLRTALWNVLARLIWDKWQPYEYVWTPDSQGINALCRRIWFSYFKLDLDGLPEFRERYGQPDAYGKMKDYFFRCKWYEVYDYVEFLAENAGGLFDADVRNSLNHVLERENSAYRLVDDNVVEITDPHEIRAIEDALSDPNAPVRAHLEAALAMLSNREEPDYRNSIKESISAVEATCRIITEDRAATLGEALKRIPKIHPALQKAFLALYGFTSDASGVRHSLLGESEITYSDAKFMLAACAAFVSYLRCEASAS